MDDDLLDLEAAYCGPSYDRRSEQLHRALAKGFDGRETARVGYWFWSGFAIGLGIGLIGCILLCWNNHRQ